MVDDRILANTSNWIAHSVASSLTAAAAIRGDETDPNLDLYTNGLLDKLEGHLAASYLADGSYGEGISYQEFDLETLAPSLVALQHVFGLDYWSRSYARDSLWYPISTLADPVSGCLDMGDSHCPAGRTIAPIVTHSHNPVFRWFKNRLKSSPLEDFLFADDTLKSTPPEGPARAISLTKALSSSAPAGSPTMPSCYSAPDPISTITTPVKEAFCSAPWVRTLSRRPATRTITKILTTTLISSRRPDIIRFWSMAILRVRKSPIRWRFPLFTSTPRFQASLRAWISTRWRASCNRCIADAWRRFTRRIAFIKPDYLIVYDELIPKERESFDWLLHLPDSARIETTADTAVYTGRTASLAVRFLSPAALKLSVTNGHLPYSTFNPVAPAQVPARPAILNASTAASAETVRFLAALAPARTAEAARQRVSSLRRIDAPGWTGVEHNGERLLFRQSPAAQGRAFDSWTTRCRGMVPPWRTGATAAARSARRHKPEARK